MRGALLLCLPLVAVAGCRPPAADDYVDRTRLVEARKGPSQPIGSPDVEGALWAEAPGKPQRLLYGQPGAAPLLALECETAAGTVPMLAYTRFARADDGAKAVLALIGNGHVERLFVDAAKQAGGQSLWQGRLPANDQRLEVLTGARQVEATIPGAGSLVLNPSTLPGALIARCRALVPPPLAPLPDPSALPE